MWTFRRASIPLKNRGFSIGASRVCHAKSEIVRHFENHNAGFIESQGLVSDRSLSYTKYYSMLFESRKLYIEIRGFSSQVDSKNSGEEDDDLGDIYPELEAPGASNVIEESNAGGENDDELISEPELFGEDDTGSDIGAVQNELKVLGAEMDFEERDSSKRRSTSALSEAILAAPMLSVKKVLDKWVKDGNEVTRTEYTLAMLNLRKRQLYTKALQLSEWLESSKCLEFVGGDYISRVDLIAKVRGVFMAESYIKYIPESFISEITYRTLLANYVSISNLKKSEEVFNKMKDLKFPITRFACDQMLLLYKKTKRWKIPQFLRFMDKENIEPSLFTYQILIDAKGQSNDISGMEHFLQTLKDEGMAPNSQIKVISAWHYINAGLKDKAEAVLKEMEGDNIMENRWACSYLLRLYASLGSASEVDRIWQVCDSNPRFEECMAAIEAWGKLSRIEDAEAVFERMFEKLKFPSPKHFVAILKVYANHKMLAKGKDLVKRMVDMGCDIGPVTWDALINLYVQAGEVEKAEIILQKATEQNKRKRPFISSYLALMDAYGERGDIHNAEKMFKKIRQAGYVPQLRIFQSLIRAYINAKAPAYGFLERMKADNVKSNKAMAALLAQVDAFRIRETAVSGLLE